MRAPPFLVRQAHGGQHSAGGIRRPGLRSGLPAAPSRGSASLFGAGSDGSGAAQQTATISPVWAPLIASAAALGYGAYAAAWPTSQRWGASLSRLPTDEKRIALTFDDGPSNETARFLEALDRWGVPATFFLCGKNVQRRPGTARDVVAAGHAVGNHTYSHPCLLVRSFSRVRAELVRTQEAIGEATGRRTALFRPPYGLRSPALRSILPELGLTGVHWTVTAMDWAWDQRRIASRIVGRACLGGIVCLHDGEDTKPTTDRSETLQAIIPVSRDQGYSFVPLPDWERRA